MTSRPPLPAITSPRSLVHAHPLHRHYSEWLVPGPRSRGEVSPRIPITPTELRCNRATQENELGSRAGLLYRLWSLFKQSRTVAMAADKLNRRRSRECLVSLLRSLRDRVHLMFASVWVDSVLPHPIESLHTRPRAIFSDRNITTICRIAKRHPSKNSRQEN